MDITENKLKGESSLRDRGLCYPPKSWGVDAGWAGGCGQENLDALSQETSLHPLPPCHPAMHSNVRGRGHDPSARAGLSVALGRMKRRRELSGRGGHLLVPKCYKAQFLEATTFHPEH